MEQYWYNLGVTSITLNTAKSPLCVCSWKTSRRQRNWRSTSGKANPGKTKTNKRRWNWLHSKAQWFKPPALNCTDLTAGTTNETQKKVEWEIYKLMLFEYKGKSGIQRQLCYWKGHFYMCHLRGNPVVISEWQNQHLFHRKSVYLTETLLNETQQKDSTKEALMDASWGPPYTRQLQLQVPATQLHLHPGATRTNCFCLGFTGWLVGTRNRSPV